MGDSAPRGDVHLPFSPREPLGFVSPGGNPPETFGSAGQGPVPGPSLRHFFLIFFSVLLFSFVKQN